MERDFKRPEIGDEYRIKARHDIGGWPVIRVLAVNWRWHRMTVQDYSADGDAAPSRGPRPFNDSPGWSALRKHWMRNTPRRSSTSAK